MRVQSIAGLIILNSLLVGCGGGGGSSGGTPESPSGPTETSFTVTASAGEGGSISPSSQTVASGDTASLSVQADSGYVIDAVSGCGGTLSGNSYTTGAITASCEVTATFELEPIPTYTVTAIAGEGGSITPASQTVTSGDTTTLTVQANSGYTIESVTGCNGTLSGDTYTTGAISANCEVDATFEPDSISGTGTAPVARILFPWKVSRTEDGEILVKGVATDDGEISSIRVNGVEAAITSSGGSGAVSSNDWSAAALQPLKSDGSTPTGSSTTGSDDEVSWEVTVPVADAENTTLVVETEDAEGNVDSASDSARVINRRVPTSFVLDEQNRRLIGQSEYGQLVTYGLDDSAYVSTPIEGLQFCGALAYRADQDQLVCATLFDSWLTLSGLGVATAEMEPLAQIDLNLDPAEWLFAHVQEAHLSTDQASLYLLLKYFSAAAYELNKSVILRYDFGSGLSETIVDGQSTDGSRVASDRFALVESGMLVFSDYWGESDHDGLNLVDFAGTGSSFLSSPANLLLAGLDVDAAETFAFMAGYEGMVKAELATGEKTILSLESEEPTFNIDQIRSVALDEANQRLLVADDGFDYILAVDTETGERSEFFGNGVGTGKRMLAPRAIAIDESKNVAYLLDDGGNAGAVLIQANLETGDREVFTAFDFDCNRTATDLVLDAASNRLFALFDNVIFSIDTETGLATKVVEGTPAGWDCGSSIYSFTGADLDTANNRLLVTDAVDDALLAVDIATGAVTELTSSTDYDAAVDVALNGEAGVAYVLSQANGDLRSYDLVSGESVLLLDSCADIYGQDILDPEVGAVQSLYFDKARGVLWISGDRLGRYDLELGQCSVMEAAGPVYGILDIEVTSQGQLLGTMFNRMIQLDFESGKYVTISK